MIKQILHNLSKCVILYRSFLMHGEGNQAVSLRFSGERYCEKKKKKKKKNSLKPSAALSIVSKEHLLTLSNQLLPNSKLLLFVSSFPCKIVRIFLDRIL